MYKIYKIVTYCVEQKKIVYQERSPKNFNGYQLMANLRSKSKQNENAII